MERIYDGICQENLGFFRGFLKQNVGKDKARSGFEQRNEDEIPRKQGISRVWKVGGFSRLPFEC